jgi:cytochrome oxidase assembly protein ShyY1
VSKARWLAYTLLALAVAGGLASLGAWQLRRAAFKTELLAEIERAQSAPVRPIEAVLAGPMSFAKVDVSGTWLSDRLIALDNQLQKGQAGVRWYAPLQLAQHTLLVDLGWRAWRDRDCPLPLPELPPAQVRGVLLPPPGAGLALGDASAAWPRLVTRLDITALEREFESPLLHFVLEPEGATTPSVRAELLPPERHRGYAVQWFGLSIAVIVIYLVLAWRARAHSRQT